jgi:hypothetical protein
VCRQGPVGRPEEGSVENNGQGGAVRDCKSRRQGFVAKITPEREGGDSSRGTRRDTETVFWRRHRFQVPSSRDREGAGRFVSPQSQSGQSFPRTGAMHLESQCEAGACECESRKWRGDRRSMKKVESRLSPFSILLLYFLTAGAVKKCSRCMAP